MIEPVEHLPRQDPRHLGDDGARHFERAGGLHRDIAYFTLRRLPGAGLEHQAEA